MHVGCIQCTVSLGVQTRSFHHKFCPNKFRPNTALFLQTGIVSSRVLALAITQSEGKDKECAKGNIYTCGF